LLFRVVEIRFRLPDHSPYGGIRQFVLTQPEFPEPSAIAAV
jgi:hypothetical protein